MLEPMLTSAAIITTDKCTAACEECCFLCNPHNKEMLTLNDMKSFIDDVTEQLSTVQLIVFTGGEATLLGQTLFDAIKYANSKGLYTRIVTNGWWAKNIKQAQRMTTKLIQSGLTEINFSTGDNHQAWVDLDTIVNACCTTVENGLLTVINIETFDGANFTVEDFLENTKIKDLYSRIDDKKMLQVLSSPWISINKKKNFTHDTINVQSDVEGCDSILNYIGLDEKGQIAACCGLTQKVIPEMNLTQMYPKLSIKEMLDKQNKDLLKIWIWLDGPKYIYDTLTTYDSSLKTHNKFIHVCQYCLEIYTNPRIQQSLLKYLTKEKTQNILNRYHLKIYYQDYNLKK